ncbi:hypothetical protein L6164_013570 [Bauhinia variegata]|uniref:Uncharacterized protein n=1 Tax=Bauhinia variegata TaxID=167791 RepID=A0ACB9NFZ7_BAUVA|nr:hypothetical protein L6164_013570 [Bauhinia variegata]
MALYFFLILSLFVGYNVVDGRSKSAEDGDPRLRLVDLEGTLPMEDDDFNCVDIYKQLAFQHPLLKNHKIQLYPSFSKNSRKIGSSYDDKGCQPGKVPVQRIKMNHIRSENLKNAPIAKFHQLSNGSPAHHSTTFHGARSSIAIYNPSVQLFQFSMALIWLVNGPPTELNAIAVGWAVNPGLYGDNLTHVTAYWTYENVSVIGGPQWLADIMVIQDKSSGHWWLVLEGDIHVGYWPKEIFSHLANGASLVSYGGSTMASLDGISPPMGSGVLATTEFGKACCFVGVKIVNSMYEETYINTNDLKSYCDAGPNCYTLIYEGYQEKYIVKGPYFTFGGPGGKCDA